MLHMLAYQQLTPVTTANDQIPALTDQIFTITNDSFLPQEEVNVYAAMGLGADIVQARIVTPTLRQVSIPYILPCEPADLPPDNPNYMDMRGNPLKLRRLEEIQFQSTSTGTLGDTYGALLIGTRIQPAPQGNVFTIRGTSTTTATAAAWSMLSVTWPDSLPDGQYAVVGMLYFGVGAVLGRVVFNDQNWRPGSIGIGTVTDKPAEAFLNGGMGEWGRFEQTAMPQIEVLNNAATSVHEVYLQIVRVR